ncbi:hypothetical protein [Rhizobium leguminosarum]|uniref:hypothetical protein n=1 Tax=Rhizobium leguminosarum TaxID=384 RepID=UPI0014415814|nr:hypothetical protein [Rhizobium leguminosarum]
MTGRHDNELIKIGYFLHDERLIGPSILGIGAEQDDRQDPAALLEPDPRSRCLQSGIGMVS